MKANEMPERIYIFDYDDAMVTPLKGDTVYVREDAFIEKARKWFIKRTNISQEIETNEDGEPLADSYIKYAKARLDAANEIFESFKKYMKGE